LGVIAMAHGSRPTLIGASAVFVAVRIGVPAPPQAGPRPVPVTARPGPCDQPARAARPGSGWR